MTAGRGGAATDVWQPNHRARVLTDAVIMAIAAGYTVQAGGLGLGDPSRPGPGFFPLLVGVVLVLAAGSHLLVLVVGHLRGPADVGVGRPSLRAGLIVAALAVYLVLLPLIGHQLAAALMTAAVLRLLGGRRTSVILAVAAATGFLSDALFTLVLGVSLPVGAFGLGWSAWI